LPQKELFRSKYNVRETGLLSGNNLRYEGLNSLLPQKEPFRSRYNVSKNGLLLGSNTDLLSGNNLQYEGPSSLLPQKEPFRSKYNVSKNGLLLDSDLFIVKRIFKEPHGQIRVLLKRRQPQGLCSPKSEIDRAVQAEFLIKQKTIRGDRGDDNENKPVHRFYNLPDFHAKNQCQQRSTKRKSKRSC
jgi:hypothetical protein